MWIDILFREKFALINREIIYIFDYKDFCYQLINLIITLIMLSTKRLRNWRITNVGEKYIKTAVRYF